MWALYIALALQGELLTRAAAEDLVATVLCAEAGSSDPGGADPPRSGLIAHLINFRVQARRRTATQESYRTALVHVLTSPHQFRTECRSAQRPAWLKNHARLLVRQQVHVLGKPDWLTEDVVYFTSETEPRSTKPWRQNLCHVKTTLGLRFEKVCGPGSHTSSAPPKIRASKTSKKKPPRWKRPRKPTGRQ